MTTAPYSWTYDDITSVLTVVGELDGEADEAFRAALETCSEGYARSLRVDLSEVSWLPSLVLRSLILAMRSARDAGSSLELVARPGTIAERVLAATAIPHSRR